VAGTFIKHIERAREAAQTTRPTEKNISEMTQEELDVALVDSKRRVVEANRAVAAAAAEYTRTPTLAAKLAELQRGRRNHWR
jgi:fructose-1,6-bisphosphatase